MKIIVATLGKRPRPNGLDSRSKHIGVFVSLNNSSERPWRAKSLPSFILHLQHRRSKKMKSAKIWDAMLASLFVGLAAVSAIVLMISASLIISPLLLIWVAYHPDASNFMQSASSAIRRLNMSSYGHLKLWISIMVSLVSFRVCLSAISKARQHYLALTMR